jgi:glycerol uptake facilitator protein
MNVFISELVGTAMLLLFGNGVVANVLLNKSKGNGGGWIVITLGWAMAVFIGVFAAAKSGAHLNPAVTIALAVKTGSFSLVPTYIAAQFLGAMLGTTLVWVAYKQHFDATTDAGLIKACFCNEPAIRHTGHNLITEIILSFALMLAIEALGNKAGAVNVGALDALPVSFIILAVGLSLGGPTGYAANPARDFGPRVMHALLPINNKGSNDWPYSWIPVVGPIIGMVLAVLVAKMVF